jgi:hypothetical protein
LIGEEGKGFRYIISGMNAERVLIAAECIGDAKWFIQKAASYSKERVLFGRPTDSVAKRFLALERRKLFPDQGRIGNFDSKIYPFGF